MAYHGSEHQQSVQLQTLREFQNDKSEYNELKKMIYFDAETNASHRMFDLSDTSIST